MVGYAFWNLNLPKYSDVMDIIKFAEPPVPIPINTREIISVGSVGIIFKTHAIVQQIFVKISAVFGLVF